MATAAAPPLVCAALVAARPRGSRPSWSLAPPWPASRGSRPVAALVSWSLAPRLCRADFNLPILQTGETGDISPGRGPPSWLSPGHGSPSWRSPGRGSPSWRSPGRGSRGGARCGASPRGCCRGSSLPVYNGQIIICHPRSYILHPPSSILRPILRAFTLYNIPPYVPLEKTRRHLEGRRHLPPHLRAATAPSAAGHPR